MTILDHVHRVLALAGEPLHYREITSRILMDGWTTTGAVDVKRGSGSRFGRASPGMFELNPDFDAASSTDQSLAETAPEPPLVVSTDIMSFTDAAEHILRESGGRDPKHYARITELAIARGMIRTGGSTPAATMYSVILQERRRRDARGEPQRFVQHPRGLVGLAAWVPRGLAASIEEHNADVRSALLDRLRDGSPAAFEELVGEVLVALGFEEVAVTPLGGDGGVDVRGTLVVGEVVRIRMAVQAKRWRGNAGAPVVQQVRGSLGAHEQGLIITTSDFSKRAREEAMRVDAAPVALMNGEQMAALLAEKEVGVQRDRYDLFSLPDRRERGVMVCCNHHLQQSRASRQPAVTQRKRLADRDVAPDGPTGGAPGSGSGLPDSCTASHGAFAEVAARKGP